VAGLAPSIGRKCLLLHFSWPGNLQPPSASTTSVCVPLGYCPSASIRFLALRGRCREHVRLTQEDRGGDRRFATASEGLIAVDTSRGVRGLLPSCLRITFQLFVIYIFHVCIFTVAFTLGLGLPSIGPVIEYHHYQLCRVAVCVSTPPPVVLVYWAGASPFGRQVSSARTQAGWLPDFT